MKILSAFAALCRSKHTHYSCF